MIAIYLSIYLFSDNSPISIKKTYTLSFDVEQSKAIDYQVFYTTKENLGFTEQESIRKKVESGKHHVEIYISIDKIHYIRLDFGSVPEKVIVKNFKLSGTEDLLFNDINDFGVNQINEISLSNGELQVISNQGDPYIFYKKAINFKSAYKLIIEYYELLKYFILWVFIFVVIYKGLSLYSESSDTFLVFNVLLFFLFLVIIFSPMLKIDKSDISFVENRTLAKFPSLLDSDNALNNSFGIEFNEWFNDRFATRNLLFWVNKNFRQLNSASEANIAICFNNGDICYRKDQHDVDWHYNILNSFPSILETIKNQFKPKEIYSIFYPSKNLIYSDWSFISEKKCSIYDTTAVINKIKQLQKDKSIEIIDLYDLLMKTKAKYPNTLLYYKDDHHSTEFAHNEFLDDIGFYKNVFPFEKKDCIRESGNDYCFKHGQTYQSVYYDRNTPNEQKNSYDYVSFSKEYLDCIDEKDIQVNNDKNLNPAPRPYRVFSNKCATNNIKVLVFGNSFSEAFARVIATRVKTVFRVRTHDGLDANGYDERVIPYIFTKEILEYKPDYIFSINCLH